VCSGENTLQQRAQVETSLILRDGLVVGHTRYRSVGWVDSFSKADYPVMARLFTE
jgi:hypothetical protein